MITAMLVAHTERLRFLVAFRPGDHRPAGDPRGRRDHVVHHLYGRSRAVIRRSRGDPEDARARTRASAAVITGSVRMRPHLAVIAPDR